MITVCTKCGAILDDAEDEIVLVGNGFQHVECEEDTDVTRG